MKQLNNIVLDDDFNHKDTLALKSVLGMKKIFAP